MKKDILKFYKGARLLALKHGMVLVAQCTYCQHGVDSPCENEVHHSFTVVDRTDKKRRKR